MAFGPVISREMSVLARRQSTYWARAATAAIAVLTMFWMLVVNSSWVTFAQMGSSIFLTVSGLCFAFALLVGVRATSDSISEEKRDGTLGLLFLTDLRGRHIVAGKFAACSLNSVFAILGVVPMLALAMLLGGVTLAQIGWLAVVLVNTTFLSLAAGLLTSTLSQNERKAMFGCFGAILLLTIFPFVLSFAVSDFEHLYVELVWISPLYSFICLQAAGTAFDASFFGGSLLLQHGMAWVLLGSASAILPRCIHREPSRRGARWRKLYADYVYGRKEQRRRYRAELLDRNAFLWLASRERIKAKYVWFILAFFAALFVWVGWGYPGMLYDSGIALALIVLLHFVLKIWTASEVCSRLIDDRRSGALELLLSSPLSVREIAHGQTLALRRLFLKPVVVLAGLELLLLFLQLQRPERAGPVQTTVLYLGALVTLLLDLWALKWVGMWLSLHGKSIERVLIGSIGRILVIPWVLLAVIAGGLSAIAALQNDRLPFLVVAVIWLGTGVFVSGPMGLYARANVLASFREIASEPLEARGLKRRVGARAQGVPRAGWRLVLPLLRERWLLAGSVALVAAVFVAGLGRQLYWNHRQSTELARIRAAGEPAGGQEIGRIYPVLPFAEDAFARLTRAGGVNWTRWIQPTLADQLLTRLRKGDSNVVADCERIITGNPQQVAALHEIGSYQKAYLDPASDLSWLLPVDINGYTGLAAAELVQEISKSDSAEVASALGRLFKMAELLRGQPLFVLQLHCGNALAALNSGLECALERGLLSTADLTSLQYGLDRLEQADVLTRTLVVERARFLDQIDRPNFGFPGTMPVAVAAVNGFSAMIGSRAQGLVAVLGEFQRAIDLSADPGPRLLEEMQTSENNVPGMVMFTARPGLPLNSIVYTDASNLARLRLLGAAAAAERYRRERGIFPADLATLVPGFIERVPADPFSGAPLETLVSERKFIIRPRVLDGQTVVPGVKISFEYSAPPR